MAARHMTYAVAGATMLVAWVGETWAAKEESQSTSSDVSAHASTDDDRSHPHTGQFSLRVAAVVSERIISRYDSSPTCGLAASSSEPKKFCGFAAPVALDLAIGFAPLNAIEPFAWARFGLGAESTTHTSPLVILGAGARLYTASDAAFKFFLQPAVGWELESGTGAHAYDGKQYKKDFLVQLLAGPQYDFSNNVGAYVGLGITAGMLRAIQTWLEADIGIQARF